MQPDDADTDAPLVDEACPRVERRAQRRERRRRRTRRFIERYERRRSERHSGASSPLWRPVRITTGILLIIAGAAIGWLPGPGFFLLALPGAFLLASEVRRAALLMDHIENVTVPRIKRWHARVRGGPKAEWVERDPDFWADWCRSSGFPMPANLSTGDGDGDEPSDDAGAAAEHDVDARPGAGRAAGEAAQG